MQNPFFPRLTALGLLLAWFWGAPACALEGPTVRLSQTTKGDPNAAFEVVGLDRIALAKLAKADLKQEQWTALFAVRVRQGKEGATADRPAVLGSYQVKGGILRFQPRFPLVRGLRYQAVFDPKHWPGGVKGLRGRVVAVFSIPRPARAAATAITHVYPTRNKLPENLLKFYIHFSAPMSQGNVYDHIRLLNAAGKPVKLPFLELREELWDPEGKRLTLLFDPGRIKRGLKPREDFGPVLEEGKAYTLVIDRAWADAEGDPLKQSFKKAFKVLPPVERIPDPKSWKLQAPPAGSTRPFTVTFARPMDHALLQRVVWVADGQGKKVPGTVAVTDEETRWQFTPKRPWQAGRYSLVAETTLEDLAGNNLERPFEVDVFRPIQRQVKAKTIKLAFEVRPPKK
jgi:Bacterial Ig-like domain